MHRFFYYFRFFFSDVVQVTNALGGAKHKIFASTCHLVREFFSFVWCLEMNLFSSHNYWWTSMLRYASRSNASDEYRYGTVSTQDRYLSRRSTQFFKICLILMYRIHEPSFYAPGFPNPNINIF